MDGARGCMYVKTLVSMSYPLLRDSVRDSYMKWYVWPPSYEQVSRTPRYPVLVPPLFIINQLYSHDTPNIGFFLLLKAWYKVTQNWSRCEWKFYWTNYCRQTHGGNKIIWHLNYLGRSDLRRQTGRDACRRLLQGFHISVWPSSPSPRGAWRTSDTQYYRSIC